MENTPTIKKHAESISDFRQKIKDLKSSNFPIWEMEKLTEFTEFAISKLSPFQMGEMVELIKTIDVKEYSGWYCHKHMMIKGKRGFIRDISWSDGKFNYLWEPQNQTWISSVDGKENPVTSPYHYQFNEDDFVKTTDKELTNIKEELLDDLYNAWEDGALFAINSLEKNDTSAQIISRNPFHKNLYPEKNTVCYNNTIDNKELAWLFTHCATIGMNKKSDSGKIEHDIALFTIDLKNDLDKAKELLKTAISDFFEEENYWDEKACELLGRERKKTWKKLNDENTELKKQVEKCTKELDNWHFISKYLSETTYSLEPSYHGVDGGWTFDVTDGGSFIIGSHGLTADKALNMLVNNAESDSYHSQKESTRWLFQGNEDLTETQLTKDKSDIPNTDLDGNVYPFQLRFKASNFETAKSLIDELRFGNKAKRERFRNEIAQAEEDHYNARKVAADAWSEVSKLEINNKKLIDVLTKVCKAFRTYIRSPKDKCTMEWIDLCDAVTEADGNPPLYGDTGGRGILSEIADEKTNKCEQIFWPMETHGLDDTTSKICNDIQTGLNELSKITGASCVSAVPEIEPDPKNNSYSPFARHTDGFQQVSKSDFAYLQGIPKPLSNVPSTLSDDVPFLKQPTYLGQAETEINKAPSQIVLSIKNIINHLKQRDYK